MITDRDALFAAVLAAPDDDLPRLVFADWLDETGHPANAARAAYIRLQVEAEHHPSGSSERLELTRRAEELRPTFQDEWDRDLNPGDLTGVTAVRRRGFVDEVRGPVGRIRTYAALMLAAAPVQTVRVAGDEPWGPQRGWRYWPELADLPALARLRALQLGPSLWHLGWVDPDTGEWTEGAAFIGLTGTRHLTALRRLELSGNGQGDGFVVAFVAGFDRTSFAGTLTHLDLSNNQITDAGANTLAAGRGLDRLERLILTGNRITAAGAARLRRRFGERVVV